MYPDPIFGGGTVRIGGLAQRQGDDQRQARRRKAGPCGVLEDEIDPLEPGHALEIGFQFGAGGVVPDRLVGGVIVAEIGDERRVLDASAGVDLVDLRLDAFGQLGVEDDLWVQQFEPHRQVGRRQANVVADHRLPGRFLVPLHFGQGALDDLDHLRAQAFGFERLEQLIEGDVQGVVGCIGGEVVRLPVLVGHVVTDVGKLRLLGVQDGEAVLEQEVHLAGGQPGGDGEIGNRACLEGQGVGLRSRDGGGPVRECNLCGVRGGVVDR